MIRLDVEQGSAEWLAARIGVVTASQFSKILSNKTAKLSTQSAGYAYQLLAEQALGVPMDGASSGFMVRGSDMEKSAVAYYELTKDIDTEKVGFILRDDRRVGCSPDRLVGDDGLLEIKCPWAPVHISYLLDDEGIGYRAQVQGQLWITERAWCDTLSFNPELPPALVRQPRDEPYIKALSSAVLQFCEYMEELKEKLRKFGLFSDEAADIFAGLKLVEDEIPAEPYPNFPFAAPVAAMTDEQISAGLRENEARAAKAGL